MNRPGLVLGRKPGETILIDGGIAVTVQSIGPGSVQLHVCAPVKTRVMREEIAYPGTLLVHEVSRYVALDRDGDRYSGDCPFHPAEDGAILTVDVRTACFACDQCDARGGLQEFIRARHAHERQQRRKVAA